MNASVTMAYLAICASVALATDYDALEAPFVDRFGQFMHRDWPGKVHAEEDLVAARIAEDAWLAENAAGPISQPDRYGGWAGGPQLAATGRFRTEKVDGKWWLVDPDGHLFFSHGVNNIRLVECGTGVQYRERYFSWLPERDDPAFGDFWWRSDKAAPRGFYSKPEHIPYDTYDFGFANARRKYGQEWQAVALRRVLDRMRAWGLNTIANWSDQRFVEKREFPYTATFGTRGRKIAGSTGWLGSMVDPFSPEFAENLRVSAEKEANRSGSDPLCIGWFVDNELNWGEDARELGRAVLKSAPDQPAKAEFRRILEAKYGSIEALHATWGTDYGSWEGFLAAEDIPDEERCGEDLENMHRAVARRYYSVVRDAINAAAPDVLYLGSRIAAGASDSVYEECARFCDVVSANVYNRAPLRALPPGADDKPILISEFHFGAKDRGPFNGGLVTVSSQAERAQCYLDYLRACLESPSIVGAHWFQWMDQPLTGRGDGEDYQCGLVDVADAPYPETVAAIQKVAAGIYPSLPPRTSTMNKE